MFLLVIVAAAMAISGCAGAVSSSPAPSSPGAPATAQLSVTPSSVSVAAAIGVMGSQVVTASNSGKANLSVSQVQISGTGFGLSGLTAPLSLPPGQSQSFTVTFDATASGTVSGMLTFMTNVSASPVVVPLQGIAAAATSPVTSVSISPSAPSAIVSSTIPFSATVQGTTPNTAVTWKAAKGSITAAGVYTAPSATGSDTVTATSVADSTKSASSTVTVIVAPATPAVTSIAISPASAAVLTGATAQFSASVQGTITDKSVTWKATTGTITSAGFFTAASSAGTATITATSNADKTKSATATVTVNAPPIVNSVTVSPSPASALTGATVQFAATVAGTATDKSVTWKASAGTISSAGLYTAPSIAGTATVTATSNADKTKSASSTVTVAIPVVTSVTVSPATAAVQIGGTATFSATVAGTVSNRSVTWKAKLGTITAAGVYTAPTAGGTDTVTATSVADTTKSASAKVTVAAPVVNSVSVSPTTSSVITGGTATFSATVNGNVSNKSVTWKAKLGKITAAGAYTAPAAAGSDTVTAISVADTSKSAFATITVSAPVVTSITVSPTTSSLLTGGAAQFTATVSGTVTNKSVTWKATRGAISTSGAYTAPATAGTDTVTATSVANTAKTASAAITVTAPTVSSITISPTAASLGTGGTQQFTATVAGSVTNKLATWKATRGTITSTGAYTAPGTAGNDTVTATAAADTTKSVSARITVTAPTVTSVTISPSSTSTTTGSTLTFKATVNGTVADKSVTWKASLGTISAGGVYTAPSKAGTDTVTATSDADTTKSASASVAVSTPPVSSGTVAAFPGAQGGGAAAIGGRGGKVMEVTTLADSGSGSLRACVEASGPRNCVFRVAGIITPQTQLKVLNPFITIACQTAPGEVIIGGPKTVEDTLFITTHDVIVRYCTFSADNINVPAGPDTGTMNIEIANGDNYNIMLDHVTTRWAGNKLWLTLSNYVGPNRLITTQWSMFYEPHALHPVGPGNGTNPGCVATASAPCFSSGEHDIDFHHNIFADMSHRIPESTNYSTRWVNNIVFNWEFYASEWLGAMHVDEIGNKYVAGNMNPQAQKYEIHFSNNSAPLPGNPSVYLSGNIGPNQSDPNGNQYAMANQISGENGNEEGPLPSSWTRSSPMANTEFPIVADSVSNLDSILLPTVGNSQHLDCSGNWVSHRDQSDTRIINQYKNRGPGGFWPNGITTGGPISTPQSGWTDQPVTNFSACAESQHDGIPDAWKTGQGLSTTDPNLHSTTAPNGYTYLENYINGPAGAAGSTSLVEPGPAGQAWAATRPTTSSSDRAARAPAPAATFALVSGKRGR